MGSLSQDTEKDRLPKRVKTQNKTNRGWQLLFVDDRGKIVSHAWFKRTAIMILGALLLSIACSITLCVFFIKQRNENIGLKEGHEASEVRLKALQHERDILLARLVLMESKIEASSNRKPDLKPLAVEAEKNVRQNDSVKKKNSGRKTVPEKPDRVGKENPTFGVEDFSLLYEPDPANELKIQFVMRNRSQTEKTVEGYIFIALKPDGNDNQELMIIPSAEFSEGKPVEATKGKYFRISRYKTIRFRLSRRIASERYKTATVFVFNRDGIKQFEKSFPIMIENVHS
ncbi:MAG: hypothetical protein R6X10_17020 [Desulfobacterales bacterium]